MNLSTFKRLNSILKLNFTGLSISSCNNVISMTNVVCTRAISDSLRIERLSSITNKTLPLKTTKISEEKHHRLNTVSV